MVAIVVRSRAPCAPPFMVTGNRDTAMGSFRIGSRRSTFGLLLPSSFLPGFDIEQAMFQFDDDHVTHAVATGSRG